MTKEEFLDHYMEYGSVNEDIYEKDSEGESSLVVIQVGDKYYRAELGIRYGSHTKENHKVYTDPVLVVPKEVTVTKYVVSSNLEVLDNED